MGFLSQTGVSFDPLATLSLSGTFSAGTWYDTVIQRPSLNQGIYIITVYFDTANAGASQYSCRSATVPFHWHAGGSNTTTAVTINNQQGFMGHAPNSFGQWDSAMELRIKHNYSNVNSGNQVLQIKFTNTMTLTGASSRNVTLYFRQFSQELMMQVYVLYKNSDNSVVSFLPDDLEQSDFDVHLNHHVGCSLTTNTIESPEYTEDDLSTALLPHHVSITDGVATVLTGAALEAANEAQEALFELNDLRNERNKRIAETDWWANSDLTMTAEQTAYRQALRDITDTYTSLEDVVWPTKP